MDLAPRTRRATRRMPRPPSVSRPAEGTRTRNRAEPSRRRATRTTRSLPRSAVRGTAGGAAPSQRGTAQLAPHASLHTAGGSQAPGTPPQPTPAQGGGASSSAPMSEPSAASATAGASCGRDSPRWSTASEPALP
jgi:hypothetical protein